MLRGWQAIQKGSKSFALAARLLDPSIRHDVCALYAWCRYGDDVIDGQEMGYAQAPLASGALSPRERLSQLTLATQKALAGNVASLPLFQDFQDVVTRHDIPHDYPLALLKGFAMDVEGRTYMTFEDTLDYAWHVAGVVGAMMALMMGARQDEALQRAIDLGIAFQLTNIARDVVADARIGRVYCPQDWLDEEGLQAADLINSASQDQVYHLVLRLVDEAEPLYASAVRGLRFLKPRSAFAIATALHVYRGIGQRLKRAGPDALYVRAHVPLWRKAAYVPQGGLTAISSRFASA